ncbi:TolC family protein, partial [bacterium]|nr:TolC family protein [bacterium]
MIKKYLSFLIIIATVPVYAAAEEKTSLSLDQCIAIAQQNSPAAKIALHQYKSTEWNYRAFKAGLLPQISMDMIAPQFNRSINPIVLDDGTTRFLTQKQALSSLNLSVSQEVLWTGGRFIISSGIQRLDLLSGTNSLVWQST